MTRRAVVCNSLAGRDLPPDWPFFSSRDLQVQWPSCKVSWARLHLMMSLCAARSPLPPLVPHPKALFGQSARSDQSRPFFTLKLTLCMCICLRRQPGVPDR